MDEEFDFEDPSMLGFRPGPKECDISFDDLPPRFPKARTDLKCGDCGAPMEIRPSKFGCFYGCSRWPECKGTHSAAKDGTPRGTPANKETRNARTQAHCVFDQVWKKRFLSRREAYRWIREQMDLSHTEAHIGQFSLEQCEQLIRLVYKAWPQLHTRYSRLAWGDEDG